MTYPELSTDAIPALSAAEMREVDRVMEDVLGIDLTRMMENAGRHLARLTADVVLGGEPAGRGITVLAGRGGNGGGALVAARRLAGWGALPRVWLARPRDQLAPVTARQLEVLDRLAVPIAEEGEPDAAGEVVLDGLIGYSLNGAPLGRTAELIEWCGHAEAPLVALDVPSGLDATTGERHGAAVRANATLTLALPKRGLRVADARAWAGDVYLGDIGVPPEVYAHLQLEVPPIFAPGDVLRLT